MKTRKELKSEYREMKVKMGVFQVRNMLNQKIFIGSSTDLNAIWNRTRTALRFGNFQNAELQKDWNTLGEDKFVFEILSEIKQEEDIQKDYRREVRQLEKMFIEELQPFGERGYHVR